MNDKRSLKIETQPANAVTNVLRCSECFWTTRQLPLPTDYTVIFEWHDCADYEARGVTTL